MDRHRLKNVIIFILLLVNGFLLFSISQWNMAERTARQNAVRQMVELLRADGVALNEGDIPRQTPPPREILTRDTERERQMAGFLLGKLFTGSGFGSNGYIYSGTSGDAQFRANGSFDASGTLSNGNAEDFCREFCRKFGYAAPLFQLDEAGSGAASAAAIWNGCPVYNCTVLFSIDQGSVTAVSGKALPELHTEAEPDAEPLSALAALTVFQQTRRETGVVASEVAEIYLCYEFQSTTAVPMSLAPTWCVTTDAANYYINCYTGVVSAG